MKRVDSEGRYTTVREAARVLEVHENTIRNWVDEGILQAHRLPGSGFRRILVSSVEQVLNTRDLPPGEETV